MVLIKNAKIVKQGNETRDAFLFIENGKIVKITEEMPLDVDVAKVNVIDAKRQLVAPGFIDVHVHLREPGYEEKETIKTGTMAAKNGGYTLIMPMPNIKPTPDNRETVEEYVKKIKTDAQVHIAPYATITKGQRGLENTDLEELVKAGAKAFSDDGVGVQDDKIMREAMKQAAKLDVVISAHTEDHELKNNGYVHQGAYSEKMGWQGIPSACEYKQLERDLKLVEQTGCRYNVCHISAKESVEMVRQAKKKGLQVTAEVTPHHLILCDEDVKDANEKMNPPLRGKEDRQALIEGLIDGTIDMIATDHAPHTQEEKKRGIEKAPFGIVGLETAFPLLYTNFVLKNVITLEQLIRLMSTNPAKHFGLEGKGEIKEGFDGDLVFIDLKKRKKVDPKEFASKGKNTPFDGWTLTGWPTMTWISNNLE